MKSNLDYYPHRKDSHRHPKFKLLRAMYGGGDAGWAAEGRFWALNNIISNSDNCELDLTKNRNKADAAEELGLSLEEFNNFINMLQNEEIELLQEVSLNIYSTKKVKETYQVVSKERESARVRKEKSKKHNNSDELLESSDEPNNKVKESKENKIKNKVNETDGLISNFQPSNSNLPLPLLTEEKELQPDDYYNREQVTESVIKLLNEFCDIQNPKKEEITSFVNVIMNTKQVKNQTAFKYVYDNFYEFRSLPEEKRNLGYLYARITRRINDALIKGREVLANRRKVGEKREADMVNNPDLKSVEKSLQM